jgi:hypothetical protein
MKWMYFCEPEAMQIRAVRRAGNNAAYISGLSSIDSFIPDIAG